MKAIILRLMKAIVLWLAPSCPEAIVRARGVFMDNPERLKVSAGRFNTR